MNAPFLCPMHKQWLERNEAAAKRHYDVCMDAADECVHRNDIESALAKSGEAYCVAEMRIRKAPSVQKQLLIEFTDAMYAMVSNLISLKRVKEKNKVIMQSMKVLANVKKSAI